MSYLSLINRRLRSLLTTVPGGTRHWVTVIVLIALGVMAGHWLGERDGLIRLRYQISKLQQQVFSPLTRKAGAERTRLVLVGDDEYWKGEELARRVPINRGYLARLLRSVAAANPEVIALDFNLSSPAPDGSLRENRAYMAETEQLVVALDEIARVPRGPIVVLARTIDESPDTDRYVAQSAVYDGYGLPGNRTRSGYIELPYDLRQVPLPVELVDGSELDSFSSAIVRATGAERALELAEAGEGELPYGSFLEASSFHTYPARRVLEEDPEVLDDLEHKIVIIGAGWSQFAHGVGGPVDTTVSQIGRVQKVYLHANYVEALLNPESRIFRPLPEWLAIAIEVVLSLVIALLFALRLSHRLSHRKTLLGVVAACAMVIVVAYFVYQNFGLFFDFLIPLVLLVAHSVYEKVMEWREAAHKYWSLGLESSHEERTAGDREGRRVAVLPAQETPLAAEQSG